MQQQLLAKQHELVKLQQQQLELELAETKSRLAQQAREFELKEQQVNCIFGIRSVLFSFITVGLQLCLEKLISVVNDMGIHGQGSCWVVA